MKTGFLILAFLFASSVSFAALTDVKPIGKSQPVTKPVEVVDPNILLIDKPEDNSPSVLVPEPAPVVDENAAEEVPVPPVPAPEEQEDPAALAEGEDAGSDAAAEAPVEAPVEAPAEDPVVEAPIKMDIKDYLDQAIAPKYIKINLDGYNIRSSNSFSVVDKNIAFKSGDGSVLPVTRVRPVSGKEGASVGLCVGAKVQEGRCPSPGKEHFVYVPFGHGADFQFCSSADCFGPNLSEVLEQVGNGFDITNHGADTCTVDGEDGLAGPGVSGLDSLETGGALKPEVPGAGTFKFETKPLWERQKPDIGSNWTKMILESLSKYGKKLTGASSFSDESRFCPNWGSLNANQKTEFWVHLFNGIARYESNWNLKATFDEEHFKNVRSGPINPHTYSQGMFQLSYGSASQGVYKNFCKFDWRGDRNKDVSDRTASIYDPKKQIDCAVGMMNYLVGRDGGIGWSKKRGGARFWSTLRSTNPATREVIANLKKFKPCWE